jgi:hypothetical protein
MGGWGIILDPPSPAAEVDAAERAPVAILAGLSSLFALVSDPHACAIHRLADNTKTATLRAKGLMRLPPTFLLCNPFLFGHTSALVSRTSAREATQYALVIATIVRRCDYVASKGHRGPPALLHGDVEGCRGTMERLGRAS